MSWQKQEILDHSAIYEQHCAQFKRVSSNLEEFYVGFTNKNKIIVLLEYWLFACRSVYLCYGVNATNAFFKGKYNSPARFSFLHEFGVEHNLTIEGNQGSFLFHFLMRFIKNLIFPGGVINSIQSKFRSRITRFIVSNITVSEDKNRKFNLVDLLQIYFDDFGLDDMDNLLNHGLPYIFFGEEIRTTSTRDLDLDCAAICFMDFCGYENIFLVNRVLKIRGRQHGGGYDFFSLGYSNLFEKRLCDSFLGWGLSQANSRQQRYPSKQKPKVSIQERKRLVWSEHSLLPLTYCILSPYDYLHHQNESVIKYIHEELVGSGHKYLSMVYPGLLESPAYIGKRGGKFRNTTGRGEDNIFVNDVLIFDISAHSLVHYCLEHELTFIIVISRSNLDFFTYSKAEWFGKLREARLAFFDDEVGLLSQRLSEIMSDEFEFPDTLKVFHRQKFINI